MARMIFINLPVKQLSVAVAFYEAIGFTNNPTFTDETAACMVLSEAINVMLLTHDKWTQFTSRSIPPATSSEVMLAISCDNKADVDAMIDAATANGGTVDINPKQDHDFMYGRSFADPDGHIWEPLWMDAQQSQ